MRWVGDPDLLKNIIDTIEQMTKRPFVASMAPYELEGIYHNWFNWQPVMRITPHMIQNICEGYLNMKDLILEHAIGSIFMLIKMTFSDFRLDKHNTILMILKYDKFNNNMFWEDTKGG